MCFWFKDAQRLRRRRLRGDVVIVFDVNCRAKPGRTVGSSRPDLQNITAAVHTPSVSFRYHNASMTRLAGSEAVTYKVRFSRSVKSSWLLSTTWLTLVPSASTDSTMPVSRTSLAAARASRRWFSRTRYHRRKEITIMGRMTASCKW